MRAFQTSQERQMLSIAKLLKRCFVWILTGSKRVLNASWAFVRLIAFGRWCFAWEWHVFASTICPLQDPQDHPLFFFLGGGRSSEKPGCCHKYVGMNFCPVEEDHYILTALYCKNSM